MKPTARDVLTLLVLQVTMSALMVAVPTLVLSQPLERASPAGGTGVLMGALAFPIVVDKRFPDGFRPPFARCIALWGAAGQLAICLVGLAALFLADPTLSDLGGITPFYKFPLLAAGAFVLTFFLTLWGFRSGVDSLEGIRRRRMLGGGR